MKSIISEIKAELRANMNGIASRSMNVAGMTADYRVNFGVDLPRLETIAAEIRSDLASRLDEDGMMSLAQSLWKERVRECRILAVMLYPVNRMLDEVADIWTDDIKSVELAQIAALYLFRNLENASRLAFQWIADDNEMKQIVGYYTLFHLVRKGQLSDRSQQEMIDQAQTASMSDNRQLKSVAKKLLNLIEY